MSIGFMFGGGVSGSWEIDPTSVFEGEGALGGFGGPVDRGIVRESCRCRVDGGVGADDSQGVFALQAQPPFYSIQ
jgi:hypothetical protein